MSSKNLTDSLDESAFVTRDFLCALPIRQKALIHDFRKFYEKKSVLEIGAYFGFFSTAIAEYSKKSVLLENNPACLPKLKALASKKVKICMGDMHHALWKFKPGQFDVIVCAGVLYHSASPFFLMEAMRYLRPESLLLDTRLPKNGRAIALQLNYKANTSSHRYNSYPDCGVGVELDEHILDEAMKNLGFHKPLAVKKESLHLPPKLNSPYFQRWKESYSKWWRGPTEK